MPKGYPKNGLWRGRERTADWLARQQSPYCSCGCGQQILLKTAHRHAGIPEFVLGHHARMRLGNYKGIDKWVLENANRHFCSCSCGRSIAIHIRHHSMGIPRYIRGHQPRHNLGVGPKHPAYIQDRTAVKRPRVFPRWIRLAALALYGGCCAWCGATDPLECDHILPASLGGESTLENAQILCTNCHHWKTFTEPTSRRPKSPATASRKRKKEDFNAHHRHASKLSQEMEVRCGS